MIRAPFNNDYDYLVKYVLKAKGMSGKALAVAQMFADVGILLWVFIWGTIVVGLISFWRQPTYIVLLGLVVLNVFLVGVYSYSRLLMPSYPIIFMLFLLCISNLYARINTGELNKYRMLIGRR